MNNVIKSLDEEPVIEKKIDEPFFSYKKSFLIFGLTIILGILSGFSFAYVKNMSGDNNSTVADNKTVDNNTDNTENEEAGISNQSNFKDSAVGILREGGKDGEGSYHLERPGGESQNVYLTSSGVDLSKYLGKKVKVLGETFEAQKVGWLMDVGYVEVQE